MADPRNIGGILSRGLLSTTELLNLYGIDGNRRDAIESAHRNATVSINSPAFGICYIRDQRPMSASRVAASLQDATPAEFFRFLNGQVFFWPSEERLSRMNGARAYQGMPQVVLIVRTEPIVGAYLNAIRISPINSGCTTPYAHDRSIAMFESITDFEWEKRKRPRKYRVAELTISDSVSDVWNYVARVEVWVNGGLVGRLNRPYDASLVTRLARVGRS